MIQEVKTKVDELLEYLEDKFIVDNVSEVSIREIAKKLNVNDAIVESWAEILEEQGIVKLKYKFATQYLELINKKKKKDSKSKENTKIDYNDYLSDKLKEIRKTDSEKEYDTIKKAYTSLINSFKSVTITVLNKKNRINISKKKQIADRLKNIKSKIVNLKSSIGNDNIGNSEQKIRKISNEIENEINQYSDFLEPKEKTQLLSKNQEVNVNISKLKKLEELSSLITQAKDSISKGDFNRGKDIYKQIRNQENELPKQFLRTKEELTKNVIELNKKMAEGIAKKKHDEFKAKESQINDEIIKLNEVIKEKDLNGSISKYQEIMQIMKSLPKGFSKEESLLKEKINPLYDHILRLQRTYYVDQDKENIKKTDFLMNQIFNSLKNKKYEEALKQCKIARDFSNKTSNKNHYELEKKIDEFEEKIIPIIEKTKEKIINEKEQEINKDINELKELIKREDSNSAIKEYAFINKKISELDDYGINLKIDLQEKLLPLYEQINKIIEKNKTKHFEELSDTIKNMIKNMVVLLKRNKINEAQQIYNKILMIYDELPQGFLIKRAVLRIEILSAYNQLTSYYNLLREKMLDKTMNFESQNVMLPKK